MATKSIRIRGDKELIRTLRKIRKQSPKALGAALFQEGEKIMRDSKESFVPVDLGNLKNSGHTEPPSIKMNGVTVTLGYGGAAASYAIFVHEIDKNYRVGQWKYLEVPLNNAIPKMAKSLALKANAFLRRFGK